MAIRWWLVLIAAGIVLSTIVVVTMQDERPDPQATPAPGSGHREFVHALGRLEPEGTVIQLSSGSGNEGASIAQLLVAEGDDVAAGDLLAVLDNHARRMAAVKEAEAKQAAADARLNQIRAGAKAGDIEAQEAALRLAEEQARVAERESDRARDLLGRNALSPEVAEEKKWELDRLILEQRRLRGHLDSLKEVRDVDLAVAEKELLAATASLQRFREEAAASEIRAPRNGRILRIHSYPGERISDQGVLELADVQNMQAVAEVFEADIPLLRTGLPAEVRLDASDDLLTGRVATIGHVVARKIVLTNDPVSDTDARVVEVRIRLDDSRLTQVARLSNARVEVRILLSEPRESDRGDVLQ